MCYIDVIQIEILYHLGRSGYQAAIPCSALHMSFGPVTPFNKLSLMLVLTKVISKIPGYIILGKFDVCVED